MMGTIGAFTALYGNDRPYLNRAGHLALVALSFALTVTIGVWVAAVPWLVVPVVTLIAMAAAFLCNALQVGPPGAYMFTLAVAAGTTMGAAHLTPWHVGIFVLGGGALAWILHMMGAIFSPRGPELQALGNAGNAVADYIAAIGTPGQDLSRHQAAISLHQLWTTVATHQPVQPAPNGTLSRLRAESRELHLIFAEAINATAEGKPVAAEIGERARHLADEAKAGKTSDLTDPRHVPLGRVSARRLLAEGLKPGSQPLQITYRVGIAAAIAGLLGQAISLENAYWAIAAAVLMLHQGLDWAGTVQRGLQRLAGTLLGLLVAGTILTLHPQGLWLVATMMALQFIIEMLVLRNYALAVMFITAAALTIASGGHQVASVPHLLWVRAEDTAIGCFIGLVVFFLWTRRGTSTPITKELVRTWAAMDRAARLLAGGDAMAPQVRQARRDLQHRTILLLQAYDRGAGSTTRSRAAVEHFWPSVIATQRLAYRILAAGWAIEGAAARGSNETLASELFGGDTSALHRALAAMTSTIRSGNKLAPMQPLHSFLDPEMQLLHKSVAAASAVVDSRGGGPRRSQNTGQP